MSAPETDTPYRDPQLPVDERVIGLLLGLLLAGLAVWSLLCAVLISPAPWTLAAFAVAVPLVFLQVR